MADVDARSKVRIFVYSEITPGLELAWLEHLRAFDREHPDCRFFCTIESASLPLDDAIAGLRESGMTIRKMFRDMDAADGLHGMEESTRE